MADGASGNRSPAPTLIPAISICTRCFLTCSSIPSSGSRSSPGSQLCSIPTDSYRKCWTPAAFQRTLNPPLARSTSPGAGTWATAPRSSCWEFGSITCGLAIAPFLDAMWPHVRSAAFWQIERSKSYGLPEYLQTTYDLFQFDQKTLASYNAILHLASMLAAEEVARIENDPEKRQQISRGIYNRTAQPRSKSLDGQILPRMVVGGRTSPDASTRRHVVRSTLGFCARSRDGRRRKDKLISHLESETELNGSPFGLRVMSGV